MQYRVLTLVLTLAAVALFFQNCGKVNFTTIPSLAVASKAMSNPQTNTSVPNNPENNPPPPGSPENPPVSSPTPLPSPTPSGPGNSGNPGGPHDPSNPEGGDNPGVGSNDSSDLVECDLGGPSSKVILSGDFMPGSNAAVSRVCMSSNACLNLVDVYAAARNCSLSKGAPSSPGSAASCTQIFPGSHGTCKNAKVLSDADVVNILANMGH